MVKLALLSAWHVHTTWFIGELKKYPIAEFVVVWDDDEARGRKMAERLSVPFEPNLTKVLYEYDIEGVIVECATTKHADVIIQAARAKKHIFSDKTLGLTVKECLAMKEAIEENHVKFLLSLETKTVGVYQQALKLVREGKIGRVTAAHFRRTHGGALQPQFAPAYWFDVAQTGGGVTLDLGCHGLYLLPEFCGVPKRVSCMMNELYHTRSDENSTTTIEFENGAIATAHTSSVVGSNNNLLEVLGTEGIIIISGENEFLLQSKHISGHEELAPLPKGELWENEEMPIVKFVKLISSEEQFLPGYGLETAIMLARLIECAYQSAKEQRVITY
ncbi:MAG: Gfo/Idh/MocA family oxidoreductase [Oscillospiraceae bacterium]